MKDMKEDWYDDTPKPIDYEARYRGWAENVCDACGFDRSTISVSRGFSCGDKNEDGIVVQVCMQQFHEGEFDRCIISMVYGGNRETGKLKTTYWETRDDITSNLHEVYAVTDWINPILDELETKCSKLANPKQQENTIAQFFVDTGFVQPRHQHNMYDFGFGFDSGEDADMKLTGYDGIPDNVADIRGDLNDPQAAKEHPLASIYGDYYMFVDPGARTNLDNKEPQSEIANQTNIDYRRKDLSNIESASDVHLETLEQPADEFPRHQQARSVMEPSVLLQGGTTLESPQIIEGIKYPKGTRIFIEAFDDLGGVGEDDLFEDPNAKLCPLCYDPYVGNVCPRCASGVPGAGAIKVGE